MSMLNPLHPGRILRACMGDLTVTALAKHLKMPRVNLSNILSGKLGISAAVALKLGEAFPNQDAALWLKLQSSYDLAQARKKNKKMKRAKIKPVLLKAA
jgi:addiction module HigA family antidote